MFLVFGTARGDAVKHLPVLDLCRSRQRGWFVYRGVNCTDIPDRLSSSVRLHLSAIRKYLYGVPLKPLR